MRSYIISIAAAAVIAAVVNMIAPEKWSKYVGAATGLVVVMCIAHPLFAVFRENVFEGFSYEPQISAEAGEGMLRDEIKTELAKRVGEDASVRIKAEFGRDCRVEADISVNEDGEITGVESLRIFGDSIDTAVLARMREVYGVSEVTYEGDR